MKRLIALIIAALLASPSSAQFGGMIGAQGSIFSGSPPVIATPVSLGSAGGTAGNSSMTITTTAAIPAGALVFVATSFNKGTTISGASISDGTNTYALAKSAGWDATSVENFELWYKENAAAVSSSATITITYSSTTAGGIGSIAAAGYATGILSSGSLDSTNSAKYTPGTAFSSGATATLAKSNELIIGAIGFYNANATVTEGTGFTTLVDFNPGTTSFFHIHLAYKIVAATTAINYQPTLSASNFGGSIVASFKGF
jgi:hypothetical protein